MTGTFGSNFCCDADAIANDSNEAFVVACLSKKILLLGVCQLAVTEFEVCRIEAKKEILHQ